MNKKLSRRFVCDYRDCMETATVLWEDYCADERVWWSARCPNHPATEFFTVGQPAPHARREDRLSLPA